VFFRNKKHKLDPALVRPGRADVIVEFKNASRFVCEGLFKAFYPLSGDFPIRFARRSHPFPKAWGGENDMVGSLGDEDIGRLAKEFAARIPEGDFSPAQMQGKCGDLSI
jgi:chaperone BCS1